VTQSDTATSISTVTTSEWPSVTKLPAKFSHKWKNRTALSTTDIAQAVVPLSSQSMPEGKLGLCLEF